MDEKSMNQPAIEWQMQFIPSYYQMNQNTPRKKKWDNSIVVHLELMQAKRNLLKIVLIARKH